RLPGRAGAQVHFAHVEIDSSRVRPGHHLLLRADRRPAGPIAGRERLVARHAQHQVALQPVVSMSTPLLQSYGRQREDLSAFIAREWQRDSPEGLFARHVFEAAGESGPVPAWPPLAAPAGLETGLAPVLAVAGYQLGRLTSPPPDLADKWRLGMGRLCEK